MSGLFGSAPLAFGGLVQRAALLIAVLTKSGPRVMRLQKAVETGDNVGVGRGQPTFNCVVFMGTVLVTVKRSLIL